MINNTNIRGEIEAIANGPFMPTAWGLQAYLTIDKAEVYRFDNVISEKYMGNFATDIAGYHFISVQVPFIVYRDNIIPNQKKLKIRLERTQLDASGHSDESFIVFSEHYLGFVSDPIDVDKMQTRRDDETPNEQNTDRLITVNFQLLDEELFYHMNKEVHGVFSGTVESLLYSQLLITKEGNSNTTALKSRNYRGLRGLEPDKFQNDRVYDNLVVPVGTRLNKLTKYLQNTYGISTFGINTFWFGNRWYVFPLFKHDRFDKKKRTISIYNVPKQEMPTTDKSYTVRNNNMYIISTGETKIKDESMRTANNIGTALRMTPASFYDQNFFDAGSNKVVVKGSENARVYASHEAVHGINNIRYSKDAFSSNPFPEISELNASQGGLITLSWHNADWTMLYPGMPAKIFYMKDGEVKTVIGTLLGMNVLTTTPNGMVAENIYRSSCELTFHFREE